jgi:hypothetical protein
LGNTIVKGKKMVELNSKNQIEVYKVQNNVSLIEKENIVETLKEIKNIKGLTIDEEKQFNNLISELEQFKKEENKKTLFFDSKSKIEETNLHLNESIVLFHDDGKTLLVSN